VRVLQHVYHRSAGKGRRYILERSISRNAGAWIISVAIACYVIVNLVIGLYENILFHSSAWDLGLFNQAFASTVHGTGFFTYSIEPFTNPSGSFFGVHFSPILLAILPLYALYPSVATLLAVQALALGIGAVPIYRLSRLVLGNVGSSVAIALSYLLYFPMQAANLFDFHVESFIVAPLLFSMYYLNVRKWKKFSLSIIVALSTVEYASFLVAAVGFAYLLLNIEGASWALKAKRFRDHRLLVPAMLTVVSVAWFILARQVMTTFNPAPPVAFEGANNWSLVGAGSIAQIPIYAVLYPANALRALMFNLPLKLEYVGLLFVPVLLVPLLRPRTLIAAIPWVAFAFLSNYGPYYQLGNQYVLFVVPGMFWALILALQRLRSVKLGDKMTILSRNLPRILLASSMVGFILFASFSYPDALSSSMPHSTYLNEIIGIVPSGASVLTQNNLFPHFSPDRFSVYAIPIYIPSWSVSFNSIVNLTFDKKPDFILVDGVTDPHAASVASQWLRENGGYGVYASADGIILFKRSFNGTPSFYVPVSWTLDQSVLTSQGTLVTRNSTASTGGSIQSSPNSTGSSSWVSPSNPLILPPGQYNLTLSLKTLTSFSGNLMALNVFGANGTERLSVFRVVGTISNSWTQFRFGFPLLRTDTLRLNATTTTAPVDIYLRFIQVVQTNYLIGAANVTSVTSH
jgi:uncharacterized membrane protein